MASPALPPCGIYRTTLSLENKDQQQVVPSGRLVYFHNHSEQNKPIVLLPANVTDNRWAFQERGYLVESATWINSMVPLLAQGFYTLRQDIVPAGGGLMSQGLLVQLGYNQNGEPILFPGQLMPGNRIQFPERGVKVSDLQLDLLQEAAFKLTGPDQGTAAELH